MPVGIFLFGVLEYWSIEDWRLRLSPLYNLKFEIYNLQSNTPLFQPPQIALGLHDHVRARRQPYNLAEAPPGLLPLTAPVE